MSVPPSHTPSCKGCRHFAVTYEMNFPYLCHALGFKSRRHPHVEVLAASGEACQFRQERPAPKRGG